MQEVKMFTQLLTDDDRLRAFMLSPQVDRRFKAQMLEKALAGKVSQLYYHFLLLLLRKGRQSLYQEIEYEMGRLYDAGHHRLRATVTSAVALSPQQLESLRKQLAEKYQAEVLIENTIDETILGGLVIRVGGRVLDASLRHQLDRLRKELGQAKCESTLQ